MKRRKLTHEEHLEQAAIVKRIYADPRALQCRCGEAFGPSHRSYKRLLRVEWIMDEVIGALDTEYHRVTSDARFIERGHVYYDRDLVDYERNLQT